MKKILGILLSLILVASSTMVGFAETLECEFVVQENLQVLLMPASHTNQLTEPNPVKGEYDNGYISITPLMGNQVKVHYHTPFIVLNDEGEPEEWLLNSFYYKASTYVFKVVLSTPLVAGQCSEFTLGSIEVVRGNGRNKTVSFFTPAISHITTFDTNFEPPATLYGLISGVKVDETNNNIIDQSFEFEIYALEEVDDEIVEVLFATAYSELGSGILKFSYLLDLDVYDELELPLGDYKIYEVNMPDAYKLNGIIFVDGVDISLPQGNGALFTISSNEQLLNIIIENEIKSSDISAFKFNSETLEPFANKTFSFELWSGDVLFALGSSDATGKVTFMVDDMPFTVLNLPYGQYTIKEVLPEAPFEFVKLETGIDEEPLETIYVPEYTFMAGTADTFVFNFYNKEVITEYGSDTAYAYPGYDEEDVFLGGALNEHGGPSNWGWFIYAQEGTFDVYAAAGQNDISKGFLVGTVTFIVEDNVFYYVLNLNAPYTLLETHFGVFASVSDVPNGFNPNVFNNSLPADQASILVFHAVVEYPLD